MCPKASACFKVTEADIYTFFLSSFWLEYCFHLIWKIQASGSSHEYAKESINKASKTLVCTVLIISATTQKSGLLAVAFCRQQMALVARDEFIICVL